MRSRSAHSKSVIRDVTMCTYQVIGCYKFTVSIAKLAALRIQQQTVLRLFCASEYMHRNTKILICSWDKTLMTKRQHPIPQYRKCSPQPHNPNPQTQKSVPFHTLAFCLWHYDRIRFMYLYGHDGMYTQNTVHIAGK